MKFSELTPLLIDCLTEKGITEKDIHDLNTIDDVRKLLRRYACKKWRNKPENADYHKKYQKENLSKFREYSQKYRDAKKNQGMKLVWISAEIP